MHPKWYKNRTSLSVWLWNSLINLVLGECWHITSPLREVRVKHPTLTVAVRTPTLKMENIHCLCCMLNLVFWLIWNPANTITKWVSYSDEKFPTFAGHHHSWKLIVRQIDYRAPAAAAPSPHVSVKQIPTAASQPPHLNWRIWGDLDRLFNQHNEDWRPTLFPLGIETRDVRFHTDACRWHESMYISL